MRAILKSLGRALVLGAATASVIGLAAAPALAAGSTWTVKNGGKVTATAGATMVNDTTAGLTVTCTSSVLKGTIKTGTKLPGKAIGTFKSLAFNGCTADGVSLSVTISAKMPLNALSYNKSKKTSSMTITGIHGKLSITTPITCSADINGTSDTANNGTVSATYSNTTHTLTVLTTGSNLHLYKDTCPVTKTGDAINFTSAYKFSKPTTFTSP